MQHNSDRIVFRKKTKLQKGVARIMEKYTHLSYQELCIFDNRLLMRESLRKIAVFLGRAVSTLSRNLKKNGGAFRYNPEIAHEAQKIRGRRLSKIERCQELKNYIVEKLMAGWAPAVIAARWNMLGKPVKISLETIYKWIYSYESKNLKLYEFLPRRRHKRGIRRQRLSKQIIGKTPLEQRPEAANIRKEIGHCEADLVFWQGSQSLNALTVIDRTTRYAVIVKNQSKHADIIERALCIEAKRRLPFNLLSSTFDNGTEFGNHKNYGFPTFFCKPHSPWEKGSIEQFNGMLRRWLPFGKSLKTVTQEELDEIALMINNIPRKSLGFLSPIELVEKLFSRNIKGVALQI